MKRQGKTLVAAIVAVVLLAAIFWATLPVARATWPVYTNRVGVVYIDTDDVMKAVLCDWETVHKLALLHRQEVMQVRLFHHQTSGESNQLIFSGEDVYYLTPTLDGIVVGRYRAIPEYANKWHLTFSGQQDSVPINNKLAKQVGGGARVQLLGYQGEDWDVRSPEAWVFDFSQAVDLDEL